MPALHRRPLPHRLLVAALLVASALVALVAVPSSRAATASVEIRNFAFDPATITVAVGDTVTWTNRDGAAHDAKDVDNRPPRFGTPILSTNERGSVQFDTPGTFNYYCSLHPGMRGTVVVQAAAFTEAVFLPSVTR